MAACVVVVIFYKKITELVSFYSADAGLSGSRRILVKRAFNMKYLHQVSYLRLQLVCAFRYHTAVYPVQRVYLS